MCLCQDARVAIDGRDEKCRVLSLVSRGVTSNITVHSTLSCDSSVDTCGVRFIRRKSDRPIAVSRRPAVGVTRRVRCNRVSCAPVRSPVGSVLLLAGVFWSCQWRSRVYLL